jgi:hypothetical protein
MQLKRRRPLGFDLLGRASLAHGGAKDNYPCNCALADQGPPGLAPNMGKPLRIQAPPESEYYDATG